MQVIVLERQEGRFNDAAEAMVVGGLIVGLIKMIFTFQMTLVYLIITQYYFNQLGLTGMFFVTYRLLFEWYSETTIDYKNKVSLDYNFYKPPFQ